MYEQLNVLHVCGLDGASRYVYRQCVGLMERAGMCTGSVLGQGSDTAHSETPLNEHHYVNLHHYIEHASDTL